MAHSNDCMTSTELSCFDFIIIGGGPVGLACAIGLAQRLPQAKIALFDRKPFDQLSSEPNKQLATDAEAVDPRALALNRGSLDFLLSLGIDVLSLGAQIKTIHVSYAGQLGNTLLRAAQMRMDQFGVVITYQRLLHRLQSAWQHLTTKNLPMNAGLGRCVTIAPAVLEVNLQTNIVIANGVRYQADCVIHAEGSSLATDASYISTQLNQDALVGVVSATQAQQDTAFERFTPHGPLALLPLQASKRGGQGQSNYSLVWCGAPQVIDGLLAMLDKDRLRALNQAFGSRLGRLSITGALQRFPLVSKFRQNMVENQHVFLGNTAQTLHPVAGQGLNLGFRDVATWLDLAMNHSSDMARQMLTNKREKDRLTLNRATQFLARHYTQIPILLRPTCGAMLMGLDALPSLQQSFTSVMTYGIK